MLQKRRRSGSPRRRSDSNSRSRSRSPHRETRARSAGNSDIRIPKPTTNKGVYVREVSDDHDQIGGNGASRPDIQRIGEILGLFKKVVPTKSILDEEQAALIATSLQHDSIVDGKPIISAEMTRLLNDRGNHPAIECQCKVHTRLPSLEPSSFFATSLQSIISSAAELGGDMRGGNLTNCGMELLKLIFELGGKKNITVPPELEGTSTTAHADSKKVYEIGIGEETMCRSNT